MENELPVCQGMNVLIIITAAKFPLGPSTRFLVGAGRFKADGTLVPRKTAHLPQKLLLFVSEESKYLTVMSENKHVLLVALLVAMHGECLSQVNV